LGVRTDESGFSYARIPPLVVADGSCGVLTDDHHSFE
jgi:hypothetical protein